MEGMASALRALCNAYGEPDFQIQAICNKLQTGRAHTDFVGFANVFQSVNKGIIWSGSDTFRQNSQNKDKPNTNRTVKYRKLTLSCSL